MICTRAIADCLVNSIDNEIRRYDIEMLLAGMRSFVKYGKADILEDYFTIHKVKDPAIFNLMRAWNILFWNESPKNRYFFKDPDHFFIKSYGRAFINFRQAKDMVAKDLAKARIEQLYSKNPEMCKAYSALNNDGMLYEFLLSYYNIGNLRNLVSHAQASDTVMPNLEGMSDNQSFDLCNDAISKFLAIYQSACRTVSKTDGSPKLIQDWQFKAYTGSHRLRPLEAAPSESADYRFL